MALNSSESLGTVIRSSRQRQQITLRTFAKRLGISPAFQTLIEQDRSMPDAQLIQRIARELELDPDQLCGLAGKLTPQVQKKLSQLARGDPKYFRSMLNKMAGE
jgi:transcriptional regulator with XRE-family HTH domain